jgi:hypothetical protein
LHMGNPSQSDTKRPWSGCPSRAHAPLLLALALAPRTHGRRLELCPPALLRRRHRAHHGQLHGLPLPL